MEGRGIMIDAYAIDACNGSNTRKVDQYYVWFCIIYGFKYDVLCIVRSEALRGHSDTTVNSSQFCKKLFFW